MRKCDNITLIGMPGAGKSTIGVVLAKRLGYRFVDTDLLIQEQEKRLLKEIIAQEGLDGFRRIENQVNAGLEVSRSVIAPGGSVIYCKEAMEHLKQLGPVIYLRVSYQDLAKRLGDLVDRGVALKEGQGLRELMEERGVQYEKYADYIIDEDGLTPGRVAAILESKIRRLYYVSD
ncbi:MAG: shikimate kinase [Lachnospiraceae bacterium]|nr:shikimate kinase [Lachnospiraceae bacterium]